MTIRPQTFIAALALACSTLPLALGCDSETDDALPISELTENLETPADLDIEPSGQACETWSAAAECLDGASAAFCGVYDENDISTMRFGECIPTNELDCVPGDVRSVNSDVCGETESYCRVSWEGVPEWADPECESDGGETPLVLRFDDAPISMIDAESTPMATFDISMAADGSSCVTTDWPTAATPWLALDLDHSGTIDGGHELFGSGTDLDGGKASNGFLALAAYDANHDGKIDSQDPGYADLVLWRDYDADRRSVPGELEPLAEAGVESLALDYTIDRQCDARGNCGVERAGFRHAGGRGEIVDLHMTCQ